MGEEVSTAVSEPFNILIPALIVLSIFGNFLFTLGIHQIIINKALLDPFLLANMNNNMLDFSK